MHLGECLLGLLLSYFCLVYSTLLVGFIGWINLIVSEVLRESYCNNWVHYWGYNYPLCKGKLGLSQQVILNNYPLLIVLPCYKLVHPNNCPKNIMLKHPKSERLFKLVIEQDLNTCEVDPGFSFHHAIHEGMHFNYPSFIPTRFKKSMHIGMLVWGLLSCLLMKYLGMLLKMGGLDSLLFPLMLPLDQMREKNILLRM